LVTWALPFLLMLASTAAMVGAFLGCGADTIVHDPGSASAASTVSTTGGAGGGAAGGTAGGAGGNSALCGDGSIDPGEQCDGANFGAADCTNYGFVDPMGLSCVACVIDSTTCQASCGNLAIEPGEDCDDGNAVVTDGCDSCSFACVATPLPVFLGGLTATTVSTVGGSATTTTQCSGEENSPDRVYALTPQASGLLHLWIPEQAQFDSMLYALTDCNDTNSGILCANNPGVSGREMLSFEVQSGISYYAVVDGANGAAGECPLYYALVPGTCNMPGQAQFLLWPGAPMPARGSTSGQPDASTATCGGLGGERVYALVPQFAGQVTVDLAANFDAALYVTTGCGNPSGELACDHNPNGGESLTFSVVQTVYYVVVDGNNGSNGSYTLTFTPLP
jgi:cysteine-rich repeat protein